MNDTPNTKILLDFRGLAIHAYSIGKDPDAYEVEGEEMRTPAHALENFVKHYLVPITDRHSILDIIAVHDGGNQYRKSLYPAYKEKRGKRYSEAKSANIHEAVAAVRALVDAMGILSVTGEATEADDTIAWLCQKLPGDKEIYSVDADLVQLVSPSVKLFLKNREAVDIVDDAGNIVLPQQVALYKSIVGDSSDGYSGVVGVGPAGYRDLTRVFNERALEKIVFTRRFDRLENSGNPIAEKLLAQRDLWHTCHTLAKLHPEEVERSFRLSGSGVDAVYKYRRPQWAKRLPQKEKIFDVLETHACGFLAKDIAHLIPQQILVTRENTFEFKKAIHNLHVHPWASVDFETWAPKIEAFKKAANGRDFVDVFGSQIVGMGVTLGRHAETTLYADFGHKGGLSLPMELLDELFRRAVEVDIPIVAQNCSFERSVLKHTRSTEINHLHDTMLMAAYVDENTPLPEHLEHAARLDEEEEEEEDVLDVEEVAGNGGFKSKARSGWDLKFMARRYLNYRQTEYKEVVPEGMTMADLEAERVFQYGADDPLVTVHLYSFLRTVLEIEGTWEHVRDNEFPSACLVSDAFLDGVAIDTQEMERQKQEDEEALEAAVGRMREAIKANQTEESAALGISALLAELWEEKCAKGRVERWSADAVALAYSELENKLANAVPYRDYTRVEKEHKFDITPGKLPAICEALGVPVLADLKPETIRAYCMDCYGSLNEDFDVEFMRLLKACSEAGEFAPKKRGEKYKALRDYCYEAWLAALPEDKRYVYEGFEFNLNSPAQKQVLLYGMLNLPLKLRNPKVSKTRRNLGLETGSVQTNKEAIADAMANVLAPDDWRYKVLEDLTVAQKCATRIGLFYSVWPLWVHPLDGKVHPGIRSVGTETHRPSGSNPNILQLPKRGEGVKVRRCILPSLKTD